MYVAVKENNINLKNVTQKNHQPAELTNGIERNLKMLIKDHQQLWLSQLNNKYFKKFGRHLEYKKLGYIDIVSLCKSMPQVFNIQRSHPYGDWKLYDNDLNFKHDSQLTFEKRPKKTATVLEAPTPASLEATIFGLNALPGISVVSIFIQSEDKMYQYLLHC